jgi:hypothetical protein
MLDINYWAVLVGGIVNMVVGGLWYGPLFGKMWMKGMGWDPNDKERMARMKKAANWSYPQMFITALIMVWVFAHVLEAFRIALPDMGGIAAGLQGGFYMWLGFVLPIKYGDKLWNGKAFKYVAIDLGYYLVVLLAVGAILACWR